MICPVLMLLLAAAASANHQTSLSAAQIEMKMTEWKEEAAISRRELKQMYVEDAMLAGGGRKRAVVEAEAEEWLETIQQAKRAVQASMGFPNDEPFDDGLWQGDIILRQSEAEDIILRHGGELPAHRKLAAEKRRAKRSVLSFDKSAVQRWTSPIPYTFHSSISDKPTQNAITAALAKVTKALPCVTFKFVPNPDPKSYFMNFRNPKGMTKDSCGGSSFIGMMPPDQLDGGMPPPVGNSINIYCDPAVLTLCGASTTILHEIFHSLGASHEQCRGDRDAYITLDINNVPKGKQHNFDRDANSTFTPYGLPYHYDSIMQYDAATFALDVSKPVMMAKIEPILANTRKMGHNDPICGAIDSDWDMMNRAYCLKSGCADTDIMCGWGPLGTSKCSDPAVAKKCPKTCLSGACAGGPTPGTNPATTTKSPSTCSKAQCSSDGDCCAGLACNRIFGGYCFPACSGSTSNVCSANDMLKQNCANNGAAPCCHWKGVCTCTFGGSCTA